MALQGALAGAGYEGDDLTALCDAIGGGSEAAVTGAPFTTSDTGSTAGAGVGTGTGVTINETALSAAIYTRLVAAFGQAGDELAGFCDHIAAVCTSQLGAATLTSAHTPVFAGSGDITSITIVGSAWHSAIESAATFTGDNWGDVAQAIGEECALALSSGTGSVTITGSGSPGTPGSGTGTGSIS